MENPSLSLCLDQSPGSELKEERRSAFSSFRIRIIPKGLQDSARGFNPWNASTHAPPEWAEERLHKRSDAMSRGNYVPPLQGGTLFLRHQGLKPLAESYHPFGINPTHTQG
jgi:hypothetical protein